MIRLKNTPNLYNVHLQIVYYPLGTIEKKF